MTIKKTKEVVESPVEAEIAPEQVVEVKEVETVDSPAKLAYLDMILNYKKQNPVKYAQKEASFLKKLASL